MKSSSRASRRADRRAQKRLNQLRNVQFGKPYRPHLLFDDDFPPLPTQRQSASQLIVESIKTPVESRGKQFSHLLTKLVMILKDRIEQKTISIANEWNKDFYASLKKYRDIEIPMSDADSDDSHQADIHLLEISESISDIDAYFGNFTLESKVLIHFFAENSLFDITTTYNLSNAKMILKLIDRDITVRTCGLAHSMGTFFSTTRDFWCLDCYSNNECVPVTAGPNANFDELPIKPKHIPLNAINKRLTTVESLRCLPIELIDLITGYFGDNRKAYPMDELEERKNIDNHCRLYHRGDSDGCNCSMRAYRLHLD